MQLPLGRSSLISGWKPLLLHPAHPTDPSYRIKCDSQALQSHDFRVSMRQSKAESGIPGALKISTYSVTIIFQASIDLRDRGLKSLPSVVRQVCHELDVG